jgi:hypothetical protein
MAGVISVGPPNGPTDRCIPPPNEVPQSGTTKIPADGPALSLVDTIWIGGSAWDPLGVDNMTVSDELRRLKLMHKHSTIGRTVKKATVRTFRRAGFDLRRVGEPANAPFAENSRPIFARRVAQTRSVVQALNEKYREPVFGRLPVSDLLAKLALCIDEHDLDLGCVSQLTHTLQVVEAMIADGIDDHDLLIAGLVHDLGKVILVAGEDQANVGGMTSPIGEFDEGIGLDQCIVQWSHDEFGYSRLKDHLPDHVSWLIRYHSLHFEDCEAFMDDRDRRYVREYHSLFAHYDGGTKSMFRVPKSRIEDYSDLIKEYFPDPIPF